MRKLRLLCAAFALALSLSASALADDGIMQGGKNDQPPPPAPATALSDQAGTGGIIEIGFAPADPTVVAVVLLQGVLALF